MPSLVIPNKMIPISTWVGDPNIMPRAVDALIDILISLEDLVN